MPSPHVTDGYDENLSWTHYIENRKERKLGRKIPIFPPWKMDESSRKSRAG